MGLTYGCDLTNGTNKPLWEAFKHIIVTRESEPSNLDNLLLLDGGLLLRSDGIDVVEVGLVHPLVRCNLGEILKEPEDDAEKPHEDEHRHVGSQAFRQNTIGLR